MSMTTNKCSVRRMKTLFQDRFGPYRGSQGWPSDRVQLWADLNMVGNRGITAVERSGDIDSCAFLSDDEAETFADRIATCL